VNTHTFSRQLMAFVLSGLVTVLVLVMSWPRFSAAFQFVPVQQSIRQYFSGHELPAAEIETSISRSRQAIETFDYYAWHSALSLLYYLQAGDAGTSLYDRRQQLEQSISEARLSLSAAPLQPELWLRIVQAGFTLFLSARELADNWLMAIWSGRVEPVHLMQRLQTGLALQSSLDDEGLILLRDQALLAWNLKQPEVTRMIRQGGLSRTKLETLLKDSHPDVVADMESKLGPVTP